mmetsp:Transcript_52930/g.133743  ORF Transcript_52930/g.133743 Transcript_52930/m.133743 type:complete len:460 (-) Transcript_52930:51-1430(-)
MVGKLVASVCSFALLALAPGYYLYNFSNPSGGSRQWSQHALRRLGTTAVASAQGLTASFAFDLQQQFEVLPEGGERGWLGADAAASIVIGGGRTGRRALWLYADTLLTEYHSGNQSRQWDGLQMPRSSIAMVECDSVSCGGRPEYIWREDASRVGSKIGEAAFFEPPLAELRRGVALWPVAGVAARDGKSALLVAIRVNVSDYSVLGTTLIALPDVASVEDPRKWDYKLYDVGAENVTWFTAIGFADGRTDSLYLWGHIGSDKHTTHLARATYSELMRGRWDTVEYWSRPHGDEQSQWSRHADATSLAPIGPASWEGTITWSEELGLWYSFFTDDDDITDPSIYMYVAEDMTGPWSRLKAYDIPGPFGTDGKSWSCYAAKAHPELAGAPIAGHANADLVLTYLCNERGGSKKLFQPMGMFWPSRSYWPTFVRVSVPRDLRQKLPHSSMVASGRRGFLSA